LEKAGAVGSAGVAACSCPTVRVDAENMKNATAVRMKFRTIEVCILPPGPSSSDVGEVFEPKRNSSVQKPN
jgi:hypothetical protein